MGASMVIALYRPHDGKADEVEKLLADHVPTLRQEGLATERPVTLLKAGDGTYLEIFEWVSDEAKDRAHQNAQVQSLWRRLEAVADFVTLGQLSEAHSHFPHFSPIAGISS